MRLTKEVDLKEVDSIALKYGTTNRIDPKVVFISGKAWFKPNFDDDYKEAIKSLNRRVGRIISRRVLSDGNFATQYICDIDLKSTNLIFNRCKNFTFDCFLRQKDDKPMNDILKCVRSVALDTADEIAEAFSESGFSINKKKKTIK